MNAIILSVGDELVLGQTVDTNSAWLSRQLAAVGIAAAAHLTVPDDQAAIEQAIGQSAERVELLLISGGIGPTEDDLTRQALAAVMGAPLEPEPRWLARLEEFFNKLGRPMPPSNRIQAMIPRGAVMIENSCGTAAGIDATLGDVPRSVKQAAQPPLDQLQGRPIGRVLIKMGRITREQVVEALTLQKSRGGLLGQVLIELGYISQIDLEVALAAQKGQTSEQLPGPERRQQMFGNDVMGKLATAASAAARPCRVFVMPGVPKEMKAMFTTSILPHLQQHGGVILSRTLHTFGLGESAVAQRLGTLMMRQRNPSVGTTVANGIVSLRLNARYPSPAQAQEQLEILTRACDEALGDVIFGADDDTLASVVAAMLSASHQTVCTAESCTGGLLAKMLTDIPGSSAYFTQGWVTYANRAKTDRLGVSENLIHIHGAVSEPVAQAMARHARRLARTDVALSISGVAGPGGGTATKPVGTVCIALAHQAASAARGQERFAESAVQVRTFTFSGDRDMIRDRSAKMALSMLRFHLMGKPMPF